MLKIKHLDRAMAHEAMLERERQRRLDGGSRDGLDGLEGVDGIAGSPRDVAPGPKAERMLSATVEPKPGL